MHSLDPCSLHHTHPSFFSCLCFDSCLSLFSGQEGEEAADKDNY